MKKAIAVVIVLLLAVAGILLGIAGYNGIFTAVRVEERQVGPYTLAAMAHLGPYSETIKTHDKVHTILKDDFSIDSESCFGLYYDNPREVPADKLRSETGCILTGVDQAKLEKIERKLTIKQYEARKSLVVVFPLRTKLSPMIGALRVYPAFTEYMKEKGLKAAGPALEVYTFSTADKHILYALPVVK